MEYEVLKNRPTEEIEVLKSDANEQLFRLQNNPDMSKIDYWSNISTMCKTIIKSRKNGSK